MRTQTRPNPRDTLCLHRLVFTANGSNLIWYAYHFYGGSRGVGSGDHTDNAVYHEQPTTPKKTQHEYMEKLDFLDAVIMAPLPLPR